MSAIIEFPVDRVRRPSKWNGHLLGEVVIFPGVRLERMAFSLADRLPLRSKQPAAQAQPQSQEYDSF